jgi:murein DD-endopeptidase MepM/ murein hydrolase activator NlpD
MKKSQSILHTIALCSILILSIVMPSVSLYPETLLASTRADELRNEIAKNLERQTALAKEIANYSKLYTSTTKEAQTLQNTLKQLEINRKKLEAELLFTDKKIKTTGLKIENLTEDLKEINRKLTLNSGALSNTFIEISALEARTFIETFLSGKTISDSLNDSIVVTELQEKLSNLISDHKTLRGDIESNKQNAQTEKKRLVAYQNELADKKVSVEITKKTKDDLLKQTKNKEVEYKKTIEEKKREKEAFEKELYQYESELKIIFDPNSVPDGRTGILDWPISNPFITQLFGKTVAAKKLYVSGTHNGVDFGTPIGTSVRATLSGTIWATGNTDLSPNCYSYGKWVLIKHGNGISSLYGHLSQIKVKEGDTLVTGDLIGYSGNTGYSTGPHLHLTVLATAGTRVEQYTSSKFCKSAIVPLADIKAYLDPMVYLPTYTGKR